MLLSCLPDEGRVWAEPRNRTLHVIFGKRGIPHPKKGDFLSDFRDLLLTKHKNQSDNPRELTKYRKRIGNYQVLILDEWLNYKLSEKDAKNLYELFEQRSGNNSTVFVGQYPVDEWHSRLGGGRQADSIMDRIIHNAYEIPTNETNLRKLYDSRKLKKLVDEIES